MQSHVLCLRCHTILQTTLRQEGLIHPTKRASPWKQNALLHTTKQRDDKELGSNSIDSDDTRTTTEDISMSQGSETAMSDRDTLDSSREGSQELDHRESEDHFLHEDPLSDARMPPHQQHGHSQMLDTQSKATLATCSAAGRRESPVLEKPTTAACLHAIEESSIPHHTSRVDDQDEQQPADSQGERLYLTLVYNLNSNVHFPSMLAFSSVMHCNRYQSCVEGSSDVVCFSPWNGFKVKTMTSNSLLQNYYYMLY